MGVDGRVPYRSFPPAARERPCRERASLAIAAPRRVKPGARASWRSGYAEDCKSLHPGSIPGEASKDISLTRAPESPPSIGGRRRACAAIETPMAGRRRQVQTPPRSPIFLSHSGRSHFVSPCALRRSKTCHSRVATLRTGLMTRGFGVYIFVATTVLFCLYVLQFCDILHWLPLYNQYPWWVEVSALSVSLVISVCIVGYAIWLQNNLKSILATALALYLISILAAVAILTFAKDYQRFGLIYTAGTQPGGPALPGGPTLSDYLYFSIITWTTVGYGDFVPTRESRVIAAAEALFGYIYMAVYISYMFNVLSFVANYEWRKPARRRPPAV